MDRVVEYASLSLKPSEKNYLAHKLKLLALKWAITEKSHNYLYGATFSVVTDVIFRECFVPVIFIKLTWGGAPSQLNNYE